MANKQRRQALKQCYDIIFNAKLYSIIKINDIRGEKNIQNVVVAAWYWMKLKAKITAEAYAKLTKGFTCSNISSRHRFYHQNRNIYTIYWDYKFIILYVLLFYFWTLKFWSFCYIILQYYRQKHVKLLSFSFKKL